MGIILTRSNCKFSTASSTKTLFGSSFRLEIIFRFSLDLLNSFYKKLIFFHRKNEQSNGRVDQVGETHRRWSFARSISVRKYVFRSSKVVITKVVNFFVFLLLQSAYQHAECGRHSGKYLYDVKTNQTVGFQDSLVQKSNHRTSIK